MDAHPYGYRVDPDRPRDLSGVRPDEAKAAVVAEIFATYLGEAIPLAEYQRRRQDLEQRDEALPAQERQLRARSHQHMELAGKVGSLEDFCERARGGLADATFQQRRKLVELLIDRVIVTDDEVEIRYVIPSSPESEHVRFCHMRSDYLGDPQARQVREIRTSRQLAKVHLG
jgi:site-specific DNA recombinase